MEVEAINKINSDAADIVITFPKDNLFIVTENTTGEIYTISAKYIQDILDDYNGDCEFVPENDARILFVSRNGKPLNPYEIRTFKDLIGWIQKID